MRKKSSGAGRRERDVVSKNSCYAFHITKKVYITLRRGIIHLNQNLHIQNGITKKLSITQRIYFQLHFLLDVILRPLCHRPDFASKASKDFYILTSGQYCNSLFHCAV